MVPKALLVITMAFMSAAECRRVQSGERDQDSLLQAVNEMLADPEQMELAAKQIGEIIADPKVHDQLKSFGDQLKDPRLHDQLEAMMADPHFQEQAALVQEQIEASKGQQSSLLEMDKDEMELAVKQALEGLKGSPPAEVDVERTAKHLDSFKDQLRAEPDSQKEIEAMIADPSLRDPAAVAQEQKETTSAQPASLLENHQDQFASATKEAFKGITQEHMAAVAKQLESFSEQLGNQPQLQNELESMMVDPEVQKQAANLQQQFEAMMADPEVQKQAALLQEQMGAMMVDSGVQKQAASVQEQVDAPKDDSPSLLEINTDQMEVGFKEAVKNIKANPPSQEEMAAAAKQVGDMMADPDVREQLKSLDGFFKGDSGMQKQFEAMMADPEVQKQAALLQEQMGAMMVDSDAQKQAALLQEHMEAKSADTDVHAS